MAGLAWKRAPKAFSAGGEPSRSCTIRHARATPLMNSMQTGGCLPRGARLRGLRRPASPPTCGADGAASGSRLLRSKLAKAENLGRIGEILLDADHLGHARPTAAETQQFL